MYDFETHWRFMTRATEAAFGYASASMAAATAWQDQVNTQLDNKTWPGSAPSTLAADNSFAWPVYWPMQWAAFWPAPNAQTFFSFWFPQVPGTPFEHTANGDFGAPFFRFGQASQDWNALTGLSSRAWQNDWSDAVRACCWVWPQSSWMMWHQPMTAMLMSAGMPYSVASPTARANAAALDAADAARETWRNTFSSYQSNGGHAASQFGPWMKYAMLMAPWLAFAAPSSF